MHTTIPKGIVGGFEFTVLQKIWTNGTVTRGHRRIFANAKEKQQFIIEDSTAAMSGTAYWLYPILPSGIVARAHFFRQPFSK